MEEAKTTKTPMSSSIKLDKDKKGKSIYSTILLEWILGRLEAKSVASRYRASAQLTRLSWTHAKIRGDGQTLIPQPDGHQQSVTPYVVLYLSTTGGHRDEVSYYETFLIDSILTGRRIHLRVFKDVIVDLSREGVQFEATFSKSMMSEPTYTVGPSTQPSFTESSSGPAFTKPPHTEIPPPQAPLAPDHAPWMDLSTQISSLRTRMEEISWISIKLASLHSLSVSSSGLSILRIAWRISMRR
ncbi:hypothetical protein AAG906_013581 [Vitis piasezkii]